MVILSLCFICMILVTSFFYLGIFLLLLIGGLYFYYYIIIFNKNFQKQRKNLFDFLFKLTTLTGKERILDLGAGSGFLTIQFAQHLTSGKVYAVDRYGTSTSNLLIRFLQLVRNNFVFNTLYHAKRNAKIQKVESKSSFISKDLSKPLDFKDNYFDRIVASEFFYCFPRRNQPILLEEIHRMLKHQGHVLLIEAAFYPRYEWDINHIITFFKNKNYQIKKKEIDTRIILSLKKPMILP